MVRRCAVCGVLVCLCSGLVVVVDVVETFAVLFGFWEFI